MYRQDNPCTAVRLRRTCSERKCRNSQTRFRRLFRRRKSCNRPNHPNTYSPSSIRNHLRFQSGCWTTQTSHPGSPCKHPPQRRTCLQGTSRRSPRRLTKLCLQDTECNPRPRGQTAPPGTRCTSQRCIENERTCIFRQGICCKPGRRRRNCSEGKQRS